jgi:hypothetical protein
VAYRVELLKATLRAKRPTAMGRRCTQARFDWRRARLVSYRQQPGRMLPPAHIRTRGAFGPPKVQKTARGQKTNPRPAPTPSPPKPSSLQRLGCRWLSFADPADVRERKRTWMESYGRPQTVLKTAGLTSADVHQRPPRFNLCCRDSVVVRYRPQSSASLAVILAVTEY